MYITQKFTIGKDFLESAKEAIKEAYEQRGYAPNEVMVHPSTDVGGRTFVAVSLGGIIQTVPIRVREDLKIGFALAENEALLDVCDPSSTLE